MRGLCSATGTVGTTTVIAAPLFALRDGNSAISGADRVNSVGGGFGPLRPRQPASGSASTAAIRAGVSLLVIAGLIIRKFRAAEQHAVRDRSEEHTSELQSLMRSSYAVFCLKKKKMRSK